jgi:hypothetical protein
MGKRFKFKTAATVVILAGLLAGSAGASIFTDDFNAGASPLWGNELGNWVASGGVYYAQSPSESPHTYSSLPFELQNFTIDVDINGVSDGGIWLRSDGAGHGVLLVTGGWWTNGTGLYWHEMQNFYDAGPAYNVIDGLFSQGDNIHLHIEVVGDTYSAFLNGSTIPATTLVTSDYFSGKVALYDFSGQTFDNFVLTPSVCHFNLVGDLNGDCKVDFMDFAIMANNWLVDCNADPNNLACVPK